MSIIWTIIEKATSTFECNRAYELRPPRDKASFFLGFDAAAHHAKTALATQKTAIDNHIETKSILALIEIMTAKKKEVSVIVMKIQTEADKMASSGNVSDGNLKDLEANQYRYFESMLSQSIKENKLKLEKLE